MLSNRVKVSRQYMWVLNSQLLLRKRTPEPGLWHIKSKHVSSIVRNTSHDNAVYTLGCCIYFQSPAVFCNLISSYLKFLQCIVANGNSLRGEGSEIIKVWNLTICLLNFISQTEITIFDYFQILGSHRERERERSKCGQNVSLQY